MVGARDVIQAEPPKAHPLREPHPARRILKHAFIAGFAGFFYAFVALRLAPGFIASAVSVFHFAIGRRVASGDLVPSMVERLPWTIFADMPVDHYWGYHLLLGFFALIDGGEFGMKLASAFFFGALFACLGGVLALFRVRLAAAWALMACFMPSQDWRYLMLRGEQWIVALALLVCAVAFGVRTRATRRILLLVIAYVAMLSYYGAVFLLPFHVAGVAALFIAERRGIVENDSSLPSARELLWEPLFTLAGLALGLTLSPYMDARASTWRLAHLHLFQMATDARNLYGEQEVSEYDPFPLEMLLERPIWAALLVALLAGLAWLVMQAKRGAKLRRDEILAAAFAVTGLVLTAGIVRMREYGVPMAILFLAVLSKRSSGALDLWWSRNAPRISPNVVRLALFVGIFLALVGRAPQTGDRLHWHLPIHQYEGARDILVANGTRPILNISEADCGTLLWQYEDAVCVQGLSRYFIEENSLFRQDLWELQWREDGPDEIPDIVDRFYARGVRLMATHWMHVMERYAQAHPERFERVFQSADEDVAIWRLLPNDDVRR